MTAAAGTWRTAPAQSRVGTSASSSKSLANAEVKIEMLQRFRGGHATYGESRRIQVVAHVNAHRPDGCAIAQASSHVMRCVIEIARRGSCPALALRPVALRNSEQAGKNVSSCGEDVPEIVEEHGAQILVDPRQTHRRKAKLKLVDE